MIIAGLLTGVVQSSLDLALSLLMGESPFSNGLLPVVIACLEETYTLIEAIHSFCKGSALALLIILSATECLPNIVAEELATLDTLFETSFCFLHLGSHCSG
jgi:hypothetical protein